jgi:hypothetical protein
LEFKKHIKRVIQFLEDFGAFRMPLYEPHHGLAFSGKDLNWQLKIEENLKNPQIGFASEKCSDQVGGNRSVRGLASNREIQFGDHERKKVERCLMTRQLF